MKFWRRVVILAGRANTEPFCATPIILAWQTPGASASSLLFTAVAHFGKLLANKTGELSKRYERGRLFFVQFNSYEKLFLTLRVGWWGWAAGVLCQTDSSFQLVRTFLLLFIQKIRGCFSWRMSKRSNIETIWEWCFYGEKHLISFIHRNKESWPVEMYSQNTPSLSL